MKKINLVGCPKKPKYISKDRAVNGFILRNLTIVNKGSANIKTLTIKT
jgi:hypothetical protein